MTCYLSSMKVIAEEMRNFDAGQQAL